MICFCVHARARLFAWLHVCLCACFVPQGSEAVLQFMAVCLATLRHEYATLKCFLPRRELRLMRGVLFVCVHNAKGRLGPTCARACVIYFVCCASGHLALVLSDVCDHVMALLSRKVHAVINEAS